jgi:hypothetical protein
MTNILVSRFIAATNAPTTTRRNTATEPRFKPERLDSFLRNESGFPKSRRAFGKENATAKKSIIAVASAAALILPLSAFAQGGAGTGSTSTGIGAPARPAGPGIRSNGWTQQPRAATNTATAGSTNLSPSPKNSIPPTNAIPKNAQGYPK